MPHIRARRVTYTCIRAPLALGAFVSESRDRGRTTKEESTMGEDEDGHGRDTGEGDTSSTLGQAQSIEVCFGRTKLTLC